jgi:hypothetical protein
VWGRAWEREGRSQERLAHEGRGVADDMAGGRCGGERCSGRKKKRKEEERAAHQREGCGARVRRRGI